MTILLASSNPHKLEEIAAIWQGLQRAGQGSNIDLVSLDRVDPTRHIPEPEEDQPSFEGNAILKARYYASIVGMPTIADDSGLEVDALGGEPGVRSARYAGAIGSRDIVDRANNKRLQRELEGVEVAQRTARFVCTMALCHVISSEGDALRDCQGQMERPSTDLANKVRLVTVVRGTVEGRIIASHEQPRGQNGFGYDPLFFIPSLGKTTAELAPAEKNRISHRGKAAVAMWKNLQTFGDDPATWPLHG